MNHWVALLPLLPLLLLLLLLLTSSVHTTRLPNSEPHAGSGTETFGTCFQT
jgi:hypothetical protein